MFLNIQRVNLLYQLLAQSDGVALQFKHYLSGSICNDDHRQQSFVLKFERFNQPFQDGPVLVNAVSDRRRQSGEVSRTLLFALLPT